MIPFLVGKVYCKTLYYHVHLFSRNCRLNLIAAIKLRASTVLPLDWALLYYFERISAPVINTLSSPSAKFVKLKGAR